MLINELPDGCLLTIFDNLNNLDDLINCYKVCNKWSHLIAKRTEKVKYFMNDYGFSSDYGYSSDYVYYPWVVDGTCLSKLFPDLMIAEFGYEFTENAGFDNIVALCRNQESLKGLINQTGEPIEKLEMRNYDKLEMLSCCNIESSKIPNVCNIKQLYIITDCFHASKPDASFFQNLERLHIQINAPDWHYDGPKFEKLKILELSSFPIEGENFYGFQFMDSCPNLQSAYIYPNNCSLIVGGTLNKYLQDLVIEFNYFNFGLIDWNDLERLIMKYPNLKHLALRSAPFIKDGHIEQLIHMLPNLVLLDVRECRGVTRRAADYVQSYCKRYGRSIKFYFEGFCRKIATDWPQLSDKRQTIARGFDFMKHCFIKDFGDLPHFLIPADY